MVRFRSNIAVGYGKSHASFGEILQGRRSDGKDLLVTLPIDMWSICNLTAIERRGPLVINCDLSKSKQVAEMLLEKLGVDSGYEINPLSPHLRSPQPRSQEPHLKSKFLAIRRGAHCQDEQRFHDC